MQIWNKINTLWLLALCSMIGIIGMLFVDGIFDLVCLTITLLPIFIAVWRVLFFTREKKVIHQ